MNEIIILLLVMYAGYIWWYVLSEREPEPKPKPQEPLTINGRTIPYAGLVIRDDRIDFQVGPWVFVEEWKHWKGHGGALVVGKVLFKNCTMNAEYKEGYRTVLITFIGTRVEL